jgi:hypothetical protein
MKSVFKFCFQFQLAPFYIKAIMADPRMRQIYADFLSIGREEGRCRLAG